MICFGPFLRKRTAHYASSLIPLPIDNSIRHKCTYNKGCCGKTVCGGCHRENVRDSHDWRGKEMDSFRVGNLFCRTPTPKSGKEWVSHSNISRNEWSSTTANKAIIQACLQWLHYSQCRYAWPTEGPTKGLWIICVFVPPNSGSWTLIHTTKSPTTMKMASLCQKTWQAKAKSYTENKAKRPKRRKHILKLDLFTIHSISVWTNQSKKMNHLRLVCKVGIGWSRQRSCWR